MEYGVLLERVVGLLRYVEAFEELPLPFEEVFERRAEEALSVASRTGDEEVVLEALPHHLMDVPCLIDIEVSCFYQLSEIRCCCRYLSLHVHHYNPKRIVSPFISGECFSLQWYFKDVGIIQHQ